MWASGECWQLSQEPGLPLSFSLELTSSHTRGLEPDGREQARSGCRLESSTAPSRCWGVSLLSLPVLPQVGAACQLTREGDFLCISLTRYGDTLGSAGFCSHQAVSLSFHCWQALLAEIAAFFRESGGEGVPSLCQTALQMPCPAKDHTVPSIALSEPLFQSQPPILTHTLGFCSLLL